MTARAPEMDRFMKQCRLNAISDDRYNNEPDTVEQIELFLIKCYKIQPLGYFSNLRRLAIMSSYVERISNLNTLVNLEYLWLNENSITRIEGLDKLVNLRELYLHGNQISKIEGLDNNVKLEVLWLSDNQIESLDGLSSLENLRSLYIGCNPITKIGNSLDSLQLLEELNIAGCKIGQFKEIPHLNRLLSLTNLKFKCSMFGENPVCSLCNYHTYALFHLDNIQQLDGVDITVEARQAAEATFVKKKMYYNMRIKTLKRNVSSVIRKATQHLEACKVPISNDLESLVQMRTRIEKEMRLIMDTKSEQTESSEERSTRYDMLQKKKSNVLTHEELMIRQLDSLDTAFWTFCSRVNRTLESNIDRLMIELETGGNIRLELGKPEDVWHRSCIDLVNSRFFAEDFLPLGVTGLKVTRVTRIHNRFLRTRFEEQLESIVNIQDPSYKNSMEYLFYTDSLGVKHQEQQQQPPLRVLLEDGFSHVSCYFGTPDAHWGVPLSNSVSICERGRLSNARRPQSCSTSSSSPTSPRSANGQNAPSSDSTDRPKSGHLIIAKVFLGSFTEENAKRVRTPASSAQRRSHNGHSINQTGSAAGNILNRNGRLKICQENYPNFDSVFRADSRDPKQRLWFIFDHRLILPEYLVEYEFVGDSTRDLSNTPSPSSPEAKNADLQDREESDNCRKEEIFDRDVNDETAHAFIVSDVTPENVSDKTDILCYSRDYLSFVNICRSVPPTRGATVQLLNMEPVQSEVNHTPITIISEYVLKNTTQMSDLSTVTHLDLHGNQINKIEKLDSLVQLKTLVLSFNDIQVIEGLEKLQQLEVLDLGYNRIRSVAPTSLQSLKKLRCLALNNNKLSQWSDVEAIRECAPAVEELNLQGNPLNQRRHFYRLLVIQKFTSLKLLNGIPVSDQERANPVIIRDTITEELLVERASGSRRIGFGLRIVWEPNAVSKSLAPNLKLDTPGWTLRIVYLDLSGMNIRTMMNLERLVNLKALSLANNEITRISGLEQCLKLEELTLENNSISKIGGLSTLLHLRRLDLGNNLISKLENLDLLIKLNQLSLENNAISSLNGIEALSNLMELYMGNNHISSAKEALVHLKELPKLTILDLSGNDATRDPEYRLSSIFKLRRLKILDGISIDQQEQSLAQKEYLGKVSAEMITEKIGHSNFSSVTDLDLSHLGLRELDNLDGMFPKLKNLNLSNNELRSLRGLENSSAITMLQLQDNRLEASIATKSANLGRYFNRLVNLKELHLDGNQVSSIAALQLYKLKRLQYLSLRNNAIQRVDGLGGLHQLKVLHLGKNKIKTMVEGAFADCTNLQELYMEENAIRSLDRICNLPQLKVLHLGHNRIGDLTEIDKMYGVDRLTSVTMAFNSVSRRSLYRLYVLRRFLMLKFIDGKEVTIDERERVMDLIRQQYEGQTFNQGSVVAVGTGIRDGGSSSGGGGGGRSSRSSGPTVLDFSTYLSSGSDQNPDPPSSQRERPTLSHSSLKHGHTAISEAPAGFNRDSNRKLDRHPVRTTSTFGNIGDQSTWVHTSDDLSLTITAVPSLHNGNLSKDLASNRRISAESTRGSRVGRIESRELDFKRSMHKIDTYPSNDRADTSQARPASVFGLMGNSSLGIDGVSVASVFDSRHRSRSHGRSSRTQYSSSRSRKQG